MFRGIAEGIMRSEFDKAVRDLAPGEDAFDHVIVLPDWDGAFVKATGLSDVSKRLGIAVFEGSRLVGTVQDDSPVSAVLELLEAIVA